MISPTLLMELAVAAGNAILEVYERSGPVSVSSKSDDSPLTDADRRSHEVIMDGLARLSPGCPVVSEEDNGRLVDAPVFWLVDPLDGTKEFVKKTGEFTVNIALIEHGVPTAGVVHAPVLRRTWVTVGEGAEVRDDSGATTLRVSRPADVAAPRLVASRDHAGLQVAALLARLPGSTTLSMGSSLKFCLLAEGRADMYFRDGPTMPWDTAAAHAVLRAAGGDVLALSGEPLRYHEPRARNPHFVALGDLGFPWATLLFPQESP